MKEIKKLLNAVLAGMLICTGVCACTAQVKNLQSEQDPKLAKVDMRKAKILINHAAEGKAVAYGTTYELSGIYFSNCMKEIAANYNPSVKLAGHVSSETEMINNLRAKGNIEYLIYGTIINWEDHVTEWNDMPDRINIDIKLYEVKTGKVLAHENFISSGKLLTVGGDHPQDLLAGPLIEILGKWFGSDLILNPEDYPCETPALQFDYDNAAR